MVYTQAVGWHTTDAVATSKTKILHRHQLRCSQDMQNDIELQSLKNGISDDSDSEDLVVDDGSQALLGPAASPMHPEAAKLWPQIRGIVVEVKCVCKPRRVLNNK